MLLHNTKLRRVGNSVGLVMPQSVLETAGFAEGQEVTLSAKLGQIQIVAAAQVQFGLTVEEAQALLDKENDSSVAQAAREKLRAQLQKNLSEKD